MPKKPYNHKATDIFAACGCSERDIEKLFNSLAEIMGNDDLEKVSEFIEQLEKTLKIPRELAFVMYHLLVEHSQMMTLRRVSHSLSKRIAQDMKVERETEIEDFMSKGNRGFN